MSTSSDIPAHKSPIYREVRLHAALLFRQGHEPGMIIDYLILQGIEEAVAEKMVEELAGKEITGEFHVRKEGRSNVRLGGGILAGGVGLAAGAVAVGIPVLGGALLLASIACAVPAFGRGRKLLQSAG